MKNKHQKFEKFEAAAKVATVVTSGLVGFSIASTRMSPVVKGLTLVGALGLGFLSGVAIGSIERLGDIENKVEDLCRSIDDLYDEYNDEDHFAEPVTLEDGTVVF